MGVKVCCSNIISSGSDWWAFYKSPIVFLLMCDAMFVTAFVLLAYGFSTPAWVITSFAIFIQICLGAVIVTSLFLAWLVERKQKQTNSAFNQI